MIARFKWDLSESELIEAKRIADEVVEELKPRIIGRLFPAWQCCCGTIKVPDSIATEINYPKGENTNQAPLWFVWSVRMVDPTTNKHTSSRELSQFISREELESLFARKFSRFFEGMC